MSDKDPRLLSADDLRQIRYSFRTSADAARLLASHDALMEKLWNMATELDAARAELEAATQGRDALAEEHGKLLRLLASYMDSGIAFPPDLIAYVRDYGELPPCPGCAKARAEAERLREALADAADCIELEWGEENARQYRAALRENGGDEKHLPCRRCLGTGRSDEDGGEKGEGRANE